MTSISPESRSTMLEMAFGVSPTTNTCDKPHVKLVDVLLAWTRFVVLFFLTDFFLDTQSLIYLLLRVEEVWRYPDPAHSATASLTYDSRGPVAAEFRYACVSRTGKSFLTLGIFMGRRVRQVIKRFRARYPCHDEALADETVLRYRRGQAQPCIGRDSRKMV